MYAKLRIIFCIIAVTAAAAAIFVFIFAGWIWGTVVVALAFMAAAGMFICRNKQLSEELKKNPPSAEGDFITGKVPKDDEKIR